MSSAIKRGINKYFHNFHGIPVADKPGRQRTYICIIMCPCQPCQLDIPTNCRSYTPVFINHHIDPVTAPTQRNAHIYFPFLNGPGQWMSIIRIVATLFTVTSKIPGLIPFILQVPDKSLFICIAGMIRCQTDFKLLLFFHNRIQSLNNSQSYSFSIVKPSCFIP